MLVYYHDPYTWSKSHKYHKHKLPVKLNLLVLKQWKKIIRNFKACHIFLVHFFVNFISFPHKTEFNRKRSPFEISGNSAFQSVMWNCTVRGNDCYLVSLQYNTTVKVVVQI